MGMTENVVLGIHPFKLSLNLQQDMLYDEGHLSFWLEL